ncbi:aspartate kinase [Rhodothermus marinus SG0.5JP17-172]|uniref:bifunctional aspartate kinase/diaminopimelate decarboxylase n=1 Tax=Rhodothermus marinus TaxID=29549 RepID=UPI000223DAE4|nr:bifunctional aspartate kinase/diaminopimelate decarboxylase [Rhodothermus marinus]AEN73059.1 aspartate kinase [Rhodothermus marinus SG0.5JP17-172]
MASPRWVVLKFGGTSVSTLPRWETIARIVRDRLAEGLRPVVVCSALSGISNALDRLLAEAMAGRGEAALEGIRRPHLELGRAMGLDAEALLRPYFEELERITLGAALLREVTPRLQARVMAMGELMATTLGAAYLNRIGLTTQWWDARELLEAVDEAHGNEARRYLSVACDYRPDPALQERLAAAPAEVILTQGFIARNSRGETVLLGRGGSDTSAAYLAAKLQAERLEIWTDVPGMFTANPRQIPSARLLRHLDYDEAQELATTGAKVLHPRCLEPVRAYGIPLHVKCTDHPELEGTIVSADALDVGPRVKAISCKTGITLVSMDTVGMWQQVGFLADVFGVFKRHGLSIDLIATSETNVTVSLDPQANALQSAQLEALVEDLSAYCQARVIAPCAVVSLVGRHIRALLDELTPAFEVFAEHHVYLISQAASDLNFSFVVDEDQADRLVRRLHAELFGRIEADTLFGPTWRELFAPKAEAAVARPWWHRRRSELLALAATQAPCYVYDEGTLRTQLEALRRLRSVDRIFYALKANDHPDVLRVFHEAGLGFECVSAGELEHVRTLFPELAPERLLFTPNFAPADEYRRGFELGAFVTLDNLHPLEAWPELFRNRNVLVRFDPGRGDGHHRYVRTAGAQSKFGIAPAQAKRLRELADRLGLRIVGLHAHVGSGILLPETWAETALFLAELAETYFPDVRYLDVGGGLGVPERTGAPGLDLEAVEAHLHRFKTAHPRFELWLEPGRFLVAEAGVLLARVTQVKEKGGARYAGVETGMNSLIRPALYGAYHEIVNLTRLDAPATQTVDVVGPICETGDVLGHGRRLPDTREGDVLLIAQAGAYGAVMSSHYNRRPPAREVFLPVGASAAVSPTPENAASV